MKTKTIVRNSVIAIVALLGCYIVFSAVYFHGTTPLGHGYYYASTGNGFIVALDPGAEGVSERFERKIERAERDEREYLGLQHVGPNVDGYRVYDRVIVGHVESIRSRNPNYNPDYKYHASDADKPGYFIIDVTIDEIYNGLSKREWLEKLRGFGIRAEPRLFKPSVFDEFRGRNKPAK